MRFEELEKIIPEGQGFCVATENGELLITDSDRHDPEAQEVMNDMKVLEIRAYWDTQLHIVVKE